VTRGQKILTGLRCAAIAVWMAVSVIGEFGRCDLNYVNILVSAAQAHSNDYEV
jgi:hypothetical protein